MTSRHPAPGETVLGTSHYAGGGGKGANQAVAAARLRARVGIVGRVGDDDVGRALISDLTDEGIDTTAVTIDPELPTGMALITIDSSAENTIVVSPGANMALLPDHLPQRVIAEAAVVLAQLEVPVDTVTAAAQLSAGTFLLNPAPARPLPSELLARVDVLIPNRTELESLGETQLPGATVVTLGREGALLIEGDETRRFPAPAVEAVDPTGAGDAFCAALAVSLSRGGGLAEAVERAVVAGALAATRPGAQAAMPTAAEVETLLARHLGT